MGDMNGDGGYASGWRKCMMMGEGLKLDDIYPGDEGNSQCVVLVEVVVDWVNVWYTWTLKRCMVMGGMHIQWGNVC